MRSTTLDEGLFTDVYCRVCSAQLISDSQRVAHYESRKHASKVRLYYMLHPVDGGCPAKKLRTESGGEEGDVDRNKCCTLCNMSFTSAVVAQSHYRGKIHAKRLRLLLGEPQATAPKEESAGEEQVGTEQRPQDCPPELPGAPVRPDGPSQRHCRLCQAWFNHPGMAQQHYQGKKHRRNATQARLLNQLGTTPGRAELNGLKRSHTCDLCCVTLNSVAQYHAHLQGSKHQSNLKNK